MSAPQIITVSGLPGSGTSTACDHLCTGLGWAYVNAGELFRQLAQESGLSLAEFGRQAEVDGRIDRQLVIVQVVSTVCHYSNKYVQVCIGDFL